MIEALNNIADKWFNWELAILWQVAVLIAIVWVIDLLIRRWAWPQVRYALWLLVLVKLVLPPGLTSPTSFTAEIPFLAESVVEVQISRPQTAAPPEQIVPGGQPAVGTVPEPVTQYSQTPTQTMPAAAAAALSWKAYALFVWAAGIAVLSGWLIIRLTGLRREHLKAQHRPNLPERFEELVTAAARKLKLKNTPRVILTNKLSCPAVFGVFRPVLLMPADKLKSLTRQDAEHILLHELAHIKRGDLLIHAVYMTLQIAYWFNPLLWLIRRHLQNIRELCCDATVAGILREKTAGYRETLLETARQLLAEPVDPGLGLLGLFENSNRLVDRLRWLEKKTWKHQPLRIMTIFVLVCLMAACVLPMAKLDPGPAGFVIKGTVTDAETGQPIVGAKVGDNKEYNDGKFCTFTDSNGNYEYKTWYEEHGVKAEADGYKRQDKGFGTKLFGSEKEKIIDFELLPEKDTEQSEFKATLANGVTVELVGICKYPERTFWRPDGSKAERKLFVEKSNAGGEYGVVVKVDGPNDLSFAWRSIEGAHGWNGSCEVLDDKGKKLVDEHGNKIENYEAALTNFDNKQTSTSIRIGISTDEWQNVAEYNSDRMKIEGKGTESLLFSEPFEDRRGVSIVVTGKWSGDKTQRIAAIDRYDKLHVGWSGSISGNDIQQMTGKFFDLNRNQIKSFLVQVRPYEWVEFKNVSLRPGVKTDVSIGKPEKTKREIIKEKYLEVREKPEIIREAAGNLFNKIRNADYDYYLNSKNQDVWQEFPLVSFYNCYREYPTLVRWICETFKRDPIVSVELGDVFFNDNEEWPRIYYKLILKDRAILEGDLHFEYGFYHYGDGRWYGIHGHFYDGPETPYNMHGLDWHLKPEAELFHSKRVKTDSDTIVQKQPYMVPFEITKQGFLDNDWIEITQILGPTYMLQVGQTYTIKGKYKLSSHDQAMLHIYATNGETHSKQGPIVKQGTGEFTRTFTYIKEGWLHLSFYPADGGSSFGNLYFAQKGSRQKVPDLANITSVVGEAKPPEQKPKGATMLRIEVQETTEDRDGEKEIQNEIALGIPLASLKAGNVVLPKAAENQMNKYGITIEKIIKMIEDGTAPMVILEVAEDIKGESGEILHIETCIGLR